MCSQNNTWSFRSSWWPSRSRWSYPILSHIIFLDHKLQRCELELKWSFPSFILPFIVLGCAKQAPQREKAWTVSNGCELKYQFTRENMLTWDLVAWWIRRNQVLSDLIWGPVHRRKSLSGLVNLVISHEWGNHQVYKVISTMPWLGFHFQTVF